MFLINKYYNWYCSIIERALTRIPLKNYEKHHIIPKSLGGGNLNDNLVKLTPREHFICHILLTKFTFGDSRRKMIYASNRMHYGKNRYVHTGRLYEKIRLEAIINLSLLNTGQKRSAETCKKISNSRKGKNTGPQCTEHIEKRISKIKGSTRSDDTKLKMSLSRKGKTQSESHIENRRKTLIGKVRTKESKENYRKSKLGSKNHNSISVTISGKHYHTKNEACIDLHLTRYELNKLICAFK